MDSGSGDVLDEDEVAVPARCALRVLCCALLSNPTRSLIWERATNRRPQAMPIVSDQGSSAAGSLAAPPRIGSAF